MRSNQVLIVDDNPVASQLLAQGFERLAMTATTSNGSITAMEAVRTFTPSLCVVDLQLGDESGLDLIREIRAELPTALIILLTGYGSIDVAVRAVKAGADEVLEKPITAREILARVEGGASAETLIDTPSVDRAVWEHVSRVLADCEGNKSEAARRLRKPRSWLQRYLGRQAPRA